MHCSDMYYVDQQGQQTFNKLCKSCPWKQRAQNRMKIGISVSLKLFILQQCKLNHDDLNNDGSFTLDDSSSFLVPSKFFREPNKTNILGNVLMLSRKYMLYTFIRIISIISTLNIQLLNRRSKRLSKLLHLHPDLALWLTLSGSNYPCLEYISMVPETLRFYCRLPGCLHLLKRFFIFQYTSIGSKIPRKLKTTTLEFDRFIYPQTFFWNVDTCIGCSLHLFQDISTIITLLSVILNLTNLQFEDDPDTDGVQIIDEFPLQVGRWQF